MNFFASVLTLFLIQDPIGNIPVCLSLLRTVPKQRHAWLIIRENLIALLISSIFLLSGRSILAYLHITSAGLGITGGMILFIVAIKMVFPENMSSKKTSTPIEEPFIVPLAVPLLAGPSMIAMLTLYASQYPLYWCFLALLIVSFLSTLILLLALPLYQWIGPQYLQALERLTGIILTAMAIQILLDNFSTYFKVITV